MGISDMINSPGLINVDFADVKTVMSQMGQAMIGFGSAKGEPGEGRAEEAVSLAVRNDLLEKVNKGESLAIASDQFGSPTSAKELARFILHLIDTNEYGTYHATNKGVCSRYEFAHEILKLTGKEAQMKAVPTHLSDFSKVRPAYCVLDNFIMSMTPVYTFPSWKESLKEYFKERGLYNEK